MSTTSSRNLTTLYSGAGSVVPQGAYGNANVVSLLDVGTDGGNTVGNITATGNITAPSIGFNGLSEIQFSNIAGGPIYISPATNAVYYPQVTVNDGFSPAPTVLIRNTLEVVDELTVPNITSTTIINAGNVTTGGYFIGNLLGNFSGNTTAAGSNTQVQFNDSSVLGATAGLTFDKTSNAMVVAGNITGGNVAGTIVSASGNVTGGNVNTGGVVSATGNVTGGNVNTGGVVSATGNVTGGNVLTAGQVSATGNVTGGNVLGNVFTAPGNANVIIRQIDAVNQANAVYVDANNLIIGNAGNSSKLVAVSTNQLILAVSGSGGPQMYFGPAATGNVDLRSSGGAIFGGFAANGNINLSGNVFIGNAASQTAPASTGLNLSVAGTITAAGNITAPYFFGNVQGNIVGNVDAAGSNTQVQFNDTGDILGASAGFVFDKTSNALAVTGNVSGGNVTTVGLISATGNVTGGNLILPNAGKVRGDFSSAATAGRTMFQTTSTSTSASTFLTAIPGENHLANAGILGAATGLFSTNDTGNASIFGMYSYSNRARIWSLSTGTGNVNDITFNFNSAGNLAATITPTGNITAVGNVSGANFITAGLITATGNINGANLVATANLTSTQQTIVGTANNGSAGNIVMSGKNIATDMAWLPDGGNAVTGAYGRVVVGTGWNGNITHTTTQSRLGVFDSVTRAATSTNVRSLDIDTQVSLTGNVTSNSFRQQGIGSRLRFGGGAAGNTINISGPSTGSIGTVAALQPNIDVGNVTPYFLGNTTLSHALLLGGFITTHPGGSVGNAYGIAPGAIAGGGNITNYTGFTNNLGGAGNITGNLYAFYHPNVAGSAQQSAVGIGISNVARAATNYYAFRNDDAVAQVQLGSLRSYNEFQYSTANTSGTVNIDKTNAQVQKIAPTGNVTIGDYQNFMTGISDSINFDSQSDTVTLIIEQGATPYTVTMPTGNAQIKYAGGVSAVGATANAVTLISISAIRNSGNTGNVYLTAISTEFV